MGNITSANAIAMISIVGLYPVPQQLQGWGVDDAFDTEMPEIAQVKIGVDGIQSSGFVPYLTKTTFTFQADSASVIIFENWAQSSKAALDIFPAFGIISIPAVSRKYTLTNGVLVNGSPLPDAKKVLAERKFTISWQDISPAPF
jgi:hypothetical protein